MYALVSSEHRKCLHKIIYYILKLMPYFSVHFADALLLYGILWQPFCTDSHGEGSVMLSGWQWWASIRVERSTKLSWCEFAKWSSTHSFWFTTWIVLTVSKDDTGKKNFRKWISLEMLMYKMRYQSTCFWQFKNKWHELIIMKLGILNDPLQFC